ncbi:zf-HC2 domain-containing protein [Polaromonas sp. YR568]|uniref:zf-HC2 domain-containing protein n=1 Tax=Polaromonas sp. YR568 TaxID=1855301 RepID=UPI003137B541
MKIQSLPLMRTCRQAAALLVAREDRALSLSDTVALRLHMLACKACPQFENQLITMRLAMGRWRNYAGEAPSPGTQDIKPD